MSIFNLPDLGEGLPDAEIQEWHVKVGDTVEVDQALVSVETAKAVVEVPSPQAGVVKKLYGENGDVIQTGAPLIEFESDAAAEDEGTVVGKIQTSSETSVDNFSVGLNLQSMSGNAQAVPAARVLAKSLNVDLDSITGTGPNGVITAEDVKKKANIATGGASVSQQSFDFEGEQLKSFRRTMSHAMSASHASVVPVTIFEDANISHWTKEKDISVTIVRALVAACKQEPALNAWFDGTRNTRKLHDTVELGLAVDTNEGLYVPVINDVENLSDEAIRKEINDIKIQSREKTLAPEKLQGATITLSNFGNFAGRYATPIIVPPMVAIIGIGKMRELPVVVDGKVQPGKELPISLTFDHRCITGGEATRFLGYLITELQK